MKTLILDLETDDLNYSRVWCVGILEAETGVYSVYKHPDKLHFERDRLAQDLYAADVVVMHNGLGFDMWVLQDLCGITIPVDKVFDTMVVSRLVDYRGLPNHKLETWGEHLGYPKLQFSDFSSGLSETMLTYMEQDVRLTYAVYKRLRSMINSRGGLDQWRSSLRLERSIEYHLVMMSRDGFYFDVTKATALLHTLSKLCEKLESGFQDDFPPQLQHVNTLKYRVTKGGTEFSTVTKARDKYPKVEVQGDELLCYDYIPFNPRSSKDRIEVLNSAGWQPTDKTDGYKKWERDRQRDESKREHWEQYGWKVNETNLATLPDTAPEGAKKLAEWLTLEGRRADLEEWLACVDPKDNRIHGGFSGMGAWTHRLAHYKPNQANIAAPYHGPTDTPVSRIKAEYDGQLRALWCVPPGSVMVGTDAEGIQLRLLAHFMKSETYRDAILSGSKENGTDIHNLNRRALLLDHITRDMAKTFIYAFLLGAGLGQVASILKCNQREAKQAVDNFYLSIDGLHQLKFETIPNMWRKGFFTGLDGRRIKPPSQHHMLAGMLQAGEAVVMKTAFLRWRETCKDIPHKLLTWPHDEWQVECFSKEDAIELGKRQCDAIEWAGQELNLFCPMSGETRIGFNWAETH